MYTTNLKEEENYRELKKSISIIVLDASGNDIKRTYNQYVWIPCTEEEYKRTEWGVEEDGTKELKASRSSKDETTLGSVTYTDDNGA